MKPSNSKAIYAILCDNIEEIQKVEKTSFAKCDALVKMSNAALAIDMNEQSKAKTKMLLETHNKTFGKVELREVEGKAFDNAQEQ